MSEAKTAADKVIIKRTGAVGEIILNNPERHNAISLDMWQKIVEALTEAAADNTIRVLMIAGAGGKAFAAGADISRFESERASLEAVRHYNKVSAQAAERLYNFPRPTVAKIQGYCFGGGVNIAACCDMRFASTDATFSIPAARLGLGYGYAGVKRLSEVVGLPAAMDMFYTARRLNAEEALAIGLVNKVIPTTEIDEVVAGIVRGICENAPLTIATIKAIVREIGKPSATRDLKKLDAMVEACFTSQDYAEGRRAFMEKRKPNFTGS